MAIDTRQKRASALVVCSRWSPPGLLPDGAIAGTDRQQIGWGYIGIPVVPPSVGIGSRRLLVGVGR